MKALVGAFSQEKALVGAFSVIVKTGCETDGALHSTSMVTLLPGSGILHRQLGTEAATAGHGRDTDLMPPPT